MELQAKESGARIRRALGEYMIIYAVIILIAVLSITSRSFLSVNNLMNVMRQTSMIAIIAVGIYFIMVGGGIDISVGSLVGLTGIVFSAGIVTLGWNPLLAALIALVIGGAAGAITGFTASYIGIPSFIATLGMMSVARGLTYVITNAYPVSGLPQSIAFVGRGYVAYWDSLNAGIPWPVVIMIVVYIAASFVSQRTKFGRFVYAAGGNPEAAYLSGIKVKRTLLTTFVIGGVLSALSGIILVSRLASGQPNAGIGWEFEAITAAVIGGVSITGGQGKLVGVFFGAILMGLLTNGMTLLDVNSYYQQIIKGLVLVFAIGLDVYKTKRQNKV
jgi:ribose/xylose/arabinose/galactoside ABC-type transport system permease subunit